MNTRQFMRGFAVGVAQGSVVFALGMGFIEGRLLLAVLGVISAGIWTSVWAILDSQKPTS